MTGRLAKHEVAIVTATRYPKFHDHYSDDYLRGTLALEMIEHAVRKDFPVFVIDQFSSTEFVTELNNRGIFPRIQLEDGMSRGRQQGFSDAFRSSSVIQAVQWVEPEKVSFVKDGALETCIAALDRDTMIVIPKRSEASLLTLPPFQSRTESEGNRMYMEYLRTLYGLTKEVPDLDMFFGPRLFRREVLPLFLQRHAYRKIARPTENLRPEMYSDALFFPIAYAVRAGHTLKSVEVEYAHPAAQTAAETGNKQYEEKRLSQLALINSEHFELLELLKGQESALVRIL